MIRFYCVLQDVLEWAMLASNQRPLPCESEACSFARVRRHPIPAFLSRLSRYFYRGRSPTFAPVVVKLSSGHRLPKLPRIPKHLNTPGPTEGDNERPVEITGDPTS